MHPRPVHVNFFDEQSGKAERQIHSDESCVALQDMRFPYRMFPCPCEFATLRPCFFLKEFTRISISGFL